jgi:hypothetical protein
MYNHKIQTSWKIKMELVPAILATANRQPDPKTPAIAKTVVPAAAITVTAIPVIATRAPAGVVQLNAASNGKKEA